jgi:hydrogenase-1 operon protein HyaF
MSLLRDIPITVIGTVEPDMVGDEARPIIVEDGIPLAIIENGVMLAILYDIETLLDALANSGQSGSIDLRRQPLGPEDYAKLKEVLGEGEVTATINALGLTQVRETAVHGVWWISYRNTQEETLTEVIEVTHFPEILKTDLEDIRDGVVRLRSCRANLEQEAKSRPQGGYSDESTGNFTGAC